ncbi:hypothetical protein NC651_009722 [Populus alba x Populus x berolinensis]|nr:hypothetical protein NC651_009722 [Populus alba x Populus x berolinensis]
MESISTSHSSHDSNFRQRFPGEKEYMQSMNHVHPLRRLSKMDFSFNPLNIVDTHCGDDTNTSNLLGRKFDDPLSACFVDRHSISLKEFHN